MNEIPSIEQQAPEQVEASQLEKLKSLLHYVKRHSPFYRNLEPFATLQADAMSWDDFRRLPTTSKDDLQRQNWDFLCVPRDRIAEYTSTSGTLGRPVTIALTEGDLKRLAYNEAISFACADGSAQDLYQLMLTLDRQFMAGIAYYQGIRQLGAGLVRVGPGLPSFQWETIERLRPTALVAVPSFLVKLVEYAVANRIDLNQSSVRKAICIGESLRTRELEPNELTRRINESWNIRLYGTYASTEMQTAFTECKEGRGGHVHPELIIVEVLDDQGNPVPDGQPGEVTITTLGVEAMPLIRYKTGDIAAINSAPCSCGRKTWRLGPVLGRKQQMIKLKGTTIYPPGIFDILQLADGIDDYVVEIFDGDLGTDEVKLHLLVQKHEQASCKSSLQSLFQSRLRIVPEIVFASAGEIEKLQLGGVGRKARRFVDNRRSEK